LICYTTHPPNVNSGSAARQTPLPEDSMKALLAELWLARVQIVPVLLALGILELPGIIQKRFRLAYVPIYFAVFPLGELNKDLSIYLGEDYWYGGDISENEAEDLRKQILFKSILSMAIAALAIPLFTGFLTAFFLTADSLTHFIILAVLLKLSRILRSVWDFPQHANGTTRNRLLLALIYFLYLGVLVQMILLAYHWTRPFIDARNWSGLAVSLGDLLFTRVVAEAIVLSLLTAAFVALIADRNLRQKNVADRGT
jgi:hypothetical protein